MYNFIEVHENVFICLTLSQIHPVMVNNLLVKTLILCSFQAIGKLALALPVAVCKHVSSRSSPLPL